MGMLLAGDIGGTKTLLGLFDPAPRRPSPVATHEFITLEYDGLELMIRRFLEMRGVTPDRITAASLGVAGAITDQAANLTNVPWRLHAGDVARAMGFRSLHLLNDLEALAYAIPVLTPDELAVLQQGVPVADGNAAVIAAGTGLGEALLLHVEDRFAPGESEGGHADFAARTARELELVSVLTRIFGRVSAEHVLSGPGLVNLYGFTHDAFSDAPGATGAGAAPARTCEAVGPVEDPAELPPLITAAADAGTCTKCVETVDMFVSAYGAEAGNLALRTVATAGVYVGGGIAPRILPALRAGPFMEAFLAKAPMDKLVARIPVQVILNPASGLLGAAVHANGSRPQA